MFEMTFEFYQPEVGELCHIKYLRVKYEQGPVLICI